RGATVAHRVGLEGNRHVGSDARKFTAVPGRLDVGKERLAVSFLRNLRSVVDEVVERSKSGNQIARPFFTNSGHASDVVDRVAHQGEDVHYLFRRDAEFLLHASRLVPRAV